MTGFLIKAYQCVVTGYPNAVTVYAATRGKALAKCWRMVTVAEDSMTFKEALSRIRVKRCGAPDFFGAEITVGGERGFFVGYQGSHIRFARPGSETILLSHPADVQGLPET